MNLQARIESDSLIAMKARDALTLGVLRMLRAAAKMLQVELRRPLTGLIWSKKRSGNWLSLLPIFPLP